MASMDTACGKSVTVPDSGSKAEIARKLGAAFSAHLDSCSDRRCRPSDEDVDLVRKAFGGM